MTDSTKTTIADVAEDWIADQSLSTEQRDWLLEAHTENVESVGYPEQAHIAPGHYCSEFDLPAGSTWIEIAAALLDLAEGNKNDQRLHEVQRAWGLGDSDDDAEDLGHD
jgi:hypothetical protein